MGFRDQNRKPSQFEPIGRICEGSAIGACLSPIARRPAEGPLPQPTAGAQPWPRERVLMPPFRSFPRL